MSLYETYLSKSKEYLINEIFNSWERNKSLQHQLEIQEKRINHYKKIIGGYACVSPDNVDKWFGDGTKEGV